ncbi:hypothetical protein YPPY48_4375, partial [Yersinia pestis PY-48]
MRERRAQSPGQ